MKYHIYSYWHKDMKCYTEPGTFQLDPITMVEKCKRHLFKDSQNLKGLKLYYVGSFDDNTCEIVYHGELLLDIDEELAKSAVILEESKDEHVQESE